MTASARIVPPPQEDPTLNRLIKAEARSDLTGRLMSMYGMVGDLLQRAEARFPELLRCAPLGVKEAASHLLAAGGKRVRPLLLALAAGACLNREARGAAAALPLDEQLVALMAAAELTHTATLLHDDVLDDARRRRGQEAARVRWGNSVSVLAGDFLLTRALEEVMRSGVPAALPALIGTIRRMIEGEALQLSLRGSSAASLTTYREIVDGKTASLFAFCGRVGALAAQAHGGRTVSEGQDDRESLAGALAAYARHLGFAFQIVDDVLDIEGESQTLGKAVLTDLREGKLTLPVILALDARPELRPLLELPAQEDTLPEHTLILLGRALAESDAPRRARAVAAHEAEEGCAALRVLPEGPCRDALWQVAHEVVIRNR